MKTEEDTEALALKINSQTKQDQSLIQSTCKNCSYHCAPL